MENLLTRQSLLTKAIVVMVAIIVLLYIHVFFDPLQVGVEKSSRFSWERFRSVQKGQTIDQVIANLGEPIREPERLYVINQASDQREDPCFPARCRTYRFFGKSNMRMGVVGYREAIIIVDADGRVVETLEREE